MRKVVVDGNAVCDAALLHAALDALERAERGDRLCRRDAAVPRRRDRRQCIGLVVRPLQRPLHAALLLPAPQHVEAVGAHGARAPAVRHPETLDLRVAAARQHPGERFIRSVRHDQAARRQRAHEMVELGFDRGEIGKDVGVIELQVVEHRGARRVMQELGALVEERRVVLIGFHYEERRNVGHFSLDVSLRETESTP